MAWIRAMGADTPRNMISKDGTAFYTFTAQNGSITYESDRIDVFLGTSTPIPRLFISGVDVTGYTQIKMKAKCSANGVSLQLQNNASYTSSPLNTTESVVTVDLTGLSGIVNFEFASTSPSKTFSIYEMELI